MAAIWVSSTLMILLSLIAPVSRNPSTVAAVSLFIMVPRLCLSLSGQESMNYLFISDKLSAPLILLTVWIAAMMVLASERVVCVQFIPVVMCLCLILASSFYVQSFFAFYILFEAALLPTLFLILSWGYQPERVQAGLYLVLYTVSASLPLLVSILFLFKENGTVSFIWKDWSLPLCLDPSIWWVFLMGAFLVKTPLYSVHLWLPKAHVEAPVAGSMVLAGVLLKLGGYGMLRVAEHIPHINNQVFPWATALALHGGVVAGVICLRQADLKALIAYSSVTHMGVVLAAIFSNTAWGWEGAVLMMVAHGLVSSSLFVLANLCYLAFQTRSLFLTKGVLCLSPVMGACWFIALGANMGAPPSINLQSELMMLLGVCSGSHWSMVFAAPLLFLSAAYCFYVFIATQHGSVSYSLLSDFRVSTRSLLCIWLHLVPVFLIVLKSGLICSWCG